MKRKKLVIFGGAALIAVLSSFSYGIYLYNKPAMKIENEEAVLTTTSKELVGSFSDNAEKMTAEFTGKVIQVKGKVSLVETSAESSIVILDNGVKCEFSDTSIAFQKGQEVVVKGIFSGYDDMFNELSLLKCLIVK